MPGQSDHQLNETDPARSKQQTYGTLSIFAWAAVGIMVLNVSYFVGSEVGAEIVHSSRDVIAILQSFLIGTLKASPTIFIAAALIGFALFFHRCSEGDVFSAGNVSTLRSGADSLIAAAAMSALVVPFVLDRVGETSEGKFLAFTDLALGVGLMGIALHGFAIVLKDAVALKADNDQFV